MTVVGGNVILITMDEIRPDHLGCYGYGKKITPNIDSLAREGTIFENCFATSNLTPISHASILTGLYPKAHGVRDPFCYVQTEMISETLKKSGYRTAGFVGNGLIGNSHGFGKGFDFFDEPTEETSWETFSFSSYNPKDDEKFYFGNLWPDKMLAWIGKNKKEKFFVFGHYYHCHEGAEFPLLEKGLIEKGKNAEFSYYDAKIEFMDKALIKPLKETLKENGTYKETMIILTADHGTTLHEGEHPIPASLPHRKNKNYPQHRTMYDTDMMVPLIVVGGGFPKGRRIKSLVRSIDIVPTIKAALDVPSGEHDGIDLMPIVKGSEKGPGFAYSEAFYEDRPPGSMQALRTQRHKFIRNVSAGVDEFYRISTDPEEHNNVVGKLTEEEAAEVARFKVFMNEQLPGAKEEYRKAFTEDEEKIIAERLKRLGYID